MCECCGGDCKLTNPIELSRDLTEEEFNAKLKIIMDDPRWQEFARKLAEL